MGEKIDDLIDFNAKDFINALIGNDFGEKMKAYIKFFFEILPLAVFFTVNSVENIQVIDSIYNIFFSCLINFLRQRFF